MLTIREAEALAGVCDPCPRDAAARTGRARCGRRCAGPSGRSPSWRSAGASYGDSFSLSFLGFERPMVLISDPAAIKALYTERAHGLPPGRNIVLEPILGSRSLLLLEGADHLARRKLMLPPFHGERMRSYEPVGRGDRRRRDRLLAARRGVPDPRADAGGDPGGDPARRLRRRRGAAAGAPARRCCHGCWRRPPRRGAAASASLTRRFGGGGPLAPGSRASCRRVDELLYAEIAEHRAQGRPGGARRHPLDADAGPLRGRRRDERHRAARPADDPAAGRPRDDGDGAGLDLRPAAAPPGARCSACATRSRPARTTTCGRRSPSRCGCAR